MNERVRDPRDSTNEVMEQEVADGGWPGLRPPQTVLAAGDELIFPKHKRVVTQYATDEAGVTVLHLHYDEKEIVFDEPALIAFGETLAKQGRFVAGSATTWGQGYAWPRVQALLEQLIEEGILRHAEEDQSEPSAPRGAWPSPLPAAPSTVARTWFDCATIMRELTGHPLELGHLELIIPVYRVAHMALDAEGRQVGEANVFPEQLRLDVSTEWRTCPYAGSRYQDASPMNVTALRSMNKYWGQMMVALLRIRDAYLRRFPHARHGWTVGDLQRLSWLVLTVPAYLLMRSPGRVENGQLHPVLSSMSRVTDGVRMVMHQMLYTSLNEQALTPDASMTSAEIYAYAERNVMFHSAHGVCAGPRTRIEEFLRVLVDGQPITGAESVVLDAPVQTALDDLESAFDYCLYGLQAYTVVFSLWPAMRHTYEQLLSIVEAWSGERSATLIALQERLARSVHSMQTLTRQTAEAYSVARNRIYADMYAQCAHGLGSTSAGTTLAVCLAPDWTAQHAEATERLRVVLRQRFCPSCACDDSTLARVVAVLMDYLRQEQALVRAACTIQQHINRLLERPAPRQPLTAFDLHLFYQLLDVKFRQPYLIEELAEVLGLHIVVTQDTMEIAERTTS